ncbi:MAG TPA: polysulfide reductase NrfD [Caldilineaceae bacterium]|nr:polysulfide reductase NrfD [Caldilineaceae bacterium]
MKQTEQMITIYQEKLRSVLETFWHNGSSQGNGHLPAASSIDNSDPDSPNNGRNIDLSLAGLMGEGAQQQHENARDHPQRSAQERWEAPATAAQTEHDGPTYYDRPVVKEPVWIWTVPLYFYVGGAAGAAAVLGAVANWFGGKQLRGLVTRCRWLAAIGANLGALLLIADLGRPERFLNMLRVFRPTSPMSVGSWVLAASGGSMTVNALIGHRRYWRKSIGRLTAVLNTVLGMGLAGYTGVLLANSVVPLWRAARQSLPVLFVGSGIASAAALLELMTLNAAEARVVRYFGLVGRTAELVTAAVVEQEAGQVERVATPLRAGRSGELWKISKYIGIVGLALALWPGRSRKKRTAAALCTTASSLLLRYALMSAGKASARDPQATFQQQRRQTSRSEAKDTDHHEQ